MEQLIVHGEENIDGQFVATVVGVLDPTTNDEFVDKITSLGRRVNVFDLRFVPLISAAGVTALLECAGTGQCQVVASTTVAKVLDVVGLAEVFEVVAPIGAPVMDRAEFGIAVHDSAMRFLYVNNAMATINGLGVGEHLGHRPSDVFDIDPDCNDVEPLLVEVLATGRSRHVRVRGETSAAVGHWSCQVHKARYRVDVEDVNMLVAIVAPVEPLEQPASHQIVFSRAN